MELVLRAIVGSWTVSPRISSCSKAIAKLSEEFDFGSIGAYGLYALNLLNSNVYVRWTYLTCRTTSLPNHNVYNRDG